jgi:hypothetical protein
MARVELGYVEAHHILPKSFNLGGRLDRDNLVYLSAREHFICHHLLMKMFTNPEFNTKMGYALWLMVNTRGLKISARRYAQVKEDILIGRVLPEETRVKIRLARAKQVIHHSAETRAKIIASNQGQTRTAETRRNMSKPRPSIQGKLNPNYGNTHSEETRKKMSLGKSGKIWVTHQITRKTQVIPPSSLPLYEQQGWVRGRG